VLAGNGMQKKLLPANCESLRRTWMPDGVYFQTKKSQLGQIFEGLVMDDVGLFYGVLVYFMAMWYILRPIGTILVIWYIVPILVSCTKG
jgi:hypothetical protein